MIGDVDAVELFANYLRVTGVAHVGPEMEGDPALVGKRLGVLNGSSWITLWANYFGRLFLPGVHLVSVGNEAVQINFMEAHERGEECPPKSNIEAFVRYAHDLVDLARVDAILITCSTMNRAYREVEKAVAPDGIPVVQIDRPMMEQAIEHGGKILVVATHGPTVTSTQALLQETADELHVPVSFCGATVEEAWGYLAKGDVINHNACLANVIRRELVEHTIDCVVLAQLSMSVFRLSYPDPPREFGVPVYTSADCGFQRVLEILSGIV